MTERLHWKYQTFRELSNEELYQILKLRCDVFIVEQNCKFQDLDGKDQQCIHVSGYRNGRIMAVSRIVPPGVSYEFASIGRVAVSAEARGESLGIELMNVSIRLLEEQFGNVTIRIGAQLYLRRFYESFGFEQTSEMYVEDEIPHIEMTRYPAEDVSN